MRNLRITLAFRGCAYHGTQVQKNALTVTEVFQDALEKVLGVREDIKNCSRLDAGVHANQFDLNIKTQSAIPCDGLLRGLNACLTGDMAVLAVREVPEDFHARYSCLGKEYLYKVHNAPIRDPFGAGLVCEYPFPLDEGTLHRAAQAFVGRHDFAAFCSAGSSVEDTVRTIHSFSVCREGEMVLFTVAGDGFLYNMVRILVGTLLDVAAGKIPVEALPEIIASRDRVRAGKTAPACGLYLNRVFYQLPLEDDAP
ncbi:tRNA pseudouridine(38-40) synthase TruA [Zongyangia hominis]|uniref:tRNA pseudouridine synthase A n=1 Tax=Zongyangia hominis TaxID=2763677 RepID=A0A926E7F2_9FIRM|nr:tRNA pseudouridine(38-40) synthase TruA [Zongyangia hominis]MBC8569225.1 tRNA pseudouridine(38-40) synthase TruA [Zongyangia hominis]